MNMRLREMMALRLDDAVGNMQIRVTTDPMVQLVRALCESSLWIIRDWPGQKIDDAESVRASRLDMLGRLRQLLRTRPPKNSEMDGLILLLADAMLTISEQWPGGESDTPVLPKTSPTKPAQQTRVQQPPPSTPPAATSVHIPPVYGTPGSTCKPPAPKLPRMVAKPWTVDGFEQPSTSTSHSISFPPAQRQSFKPPREMPQANNAGTPSRLWSFFTKAVGENEMLQAKCSVCNRMIPRHNHGTSGMKNHLKVHHPAEYATLDMENSSSQETPQSSTSVSSSHAESPKKITAAAIETTNATIMAMLNSQSVIKETSASLFNSDQLVKEEDMDDYHQDALLHLSFNSDNNEGMDEPASGQTVDPPPQHNNQRTPTKSGGSDIWSYFTKEDVGEEKHGFCKLCDWSRKIYNHGTNTMWSHLKRMHPIEYSILKPYDYNPPVHGQLFPTGVQPGTSVAYPIPEVLPRPPEL